MIVAHFARLEYPSDGMDEGAASILHSTFYGPAIVFSYYAVEFPRGYINEGFTRFPLVVGFTDLPHCPSCDHIGVVSPLLETVVLSLLIFGFLSLLKKE